MTIILAAALILTIGGFLILLDRRDQRERAERATLLVHIQAPETAVAQHVIAHAGPDEMYPATDDELVDDPETAEALKRIELRANSEAPWLS